MTSRRQFLIGAAALSEAALCPALLPAVTRAQQRETPDTIGFGLAPIKREGEPVTYDVSLELVEDYHS